MVLGVETWDKRKSENDREGLRGLGGEEPEVERNHWKETYQM
jgi:hypothetical protein